MDSQSQKVSLIFDCTGLNDYDGSITTYLKIYINENKSEFKLLGQTHTMKRDPNPKFSNKFETQFFLTKIQNIKIEIWEVHTIGKDTLYGQVNTTLVDIIIDQTNEFSLPVICPNRKDNKTGIVSMRAGNIGSNCVQWTWSARKLKNMDTFSKSDPFLLYRFLRDDGQGVYIQQSEPVMDNNDPDWQTAEVSLSTLCRSDLNRKFKIDVKDWESTDGNIKKIGHVIISINDLLTKLNCQLEIVDDNKNFVGYLICKDLKITKPAFVDYLMGGQQINIIANIDFTASNGDYSDPNSLHCNDMKKNQYLTTLKTVTNILLAFDHDKKVELYGFGGVPQYPNYKSYDTDHCFPLTGDKNNHSVIGLQGIIDAYQNSQKNVTLCGPTLFGPSLKKGMEIAAENAKNHVYTIQLILTDGVIDDFEDSQRILSMGGSLPWSVVIVGIGNDRFESMKSLDGPEVKNLAEGVSLRRDICQFVKFNDYAHDHQLLLDQILAEIPKQFQAYKLAKKEYVITSKPVVAPVQTVKVVTNEVGGYQGSAYSHCTQSSYVYGATYSTSTVVKTTITTTTVTTVTH